jgi:mRNA interferase RelE/StbE
VSYRVLVTPAPAKFLERLRDESLKRRMSKALHLLETNPRPPGCIRLQGGDELYRVRVGDYRIIYQIQDAVLVVLVVQIGHRREIYRQ